MNNPLIRHTLQDAPLDSDVSLGFYNIAGLSETTEVASLKRDLREEIHFYKYASLPSLNGTLIDLRRSETVKVKRMTTSTLSKKRRPHAFQSQAADAVGREQSKRS